ncbi:MAG TPA: helix-turn-helix domain-containing protein [Planosporangium sp.]|jgi:DNA-binding transcriptional ArsR family regulator|nr:helix-turn-helix domain-containing protein [Planosporangium sp.]
MSELAEPVLAGVPVTAVLQALADPTRLRMVQALADGTERLCGTLEEQLPKATRSHHLKVLREAGVTRTRAVGTGRYVALRREELDRHFPGLLGAVLAAARPVPTPA